MPRLAEFVERVCSQEGDDCIEFWGSRAWAGYGQVYIAEIGRMSTHRLSYDLFVGPLIPNMHVCHRCDNPPCVNPRHLFQGTAKENARDRQDKGRFTAPVFYGVEHPNAKLNAEQVSDIRARGMQGHGGNIQELAYEYGVTGPTIRSIVQGVSYRDF